MDGGSLCLGLVTPPGDAGQAQQASAKQPYGGGQGDGGYFSSRIGHCVRVIKFC